MSTLPTNLRRQLEKAINDARKIAKSGARKALEALAVHEPDPYRSMDEVRRDLRRKLRAQAKQLGDGESQEKRGAYEIKHLVEKLAYDQWHRLLFGRFLLENNLLISPEHNVSVSLADCEELAPSFGLKDAWSVAARFAAKELPEIFRADDPAGAVDLPAEDRNPLIQLVTGLPVEVFTASDSLGWCYQFWQAEEKETVNKAGKKIGADELPAVTQLFTEDYMVDFLLDNTLGAWHAGKVLAAKPELAETAQSEDELRDAVALPDVPWRYLRFIKGEEGKWVPASGTFDGWPRAAKELKCLDPCMGSGHFIVAMFERLVALRLVEERLDDSDAVVAAIRDNLFGLEIDPRCTQIAAFNLALAAWRRVGHCTLPPMNLACSGLAPNSKKEEWLRLAGESEKLQNGMDRLYELFRDAPALGSLINPRAAKSDLLSATFQELQPVFERVLVQAAKDDTAREMAVTARGLANAAELLTSQFTLVATNVPYLARGKQDDVLMDYCERVHSEAKADLATCFVERCLDFSEFGGSVSLVTPQNWLFLGSYQHLRKRVLRTVQWNSVARLGENGFHSSQAAGAFTALVSLTSRTASDNHSIAGIDVAEKSGPERKAAALAVDVVRPLNQAAQLDNPDSRIMFDESAGTKTRLEEYVESYQGAVTGDLQRFVTCFWEFSSSLDVWEPFRTAVDSDAVDNGLICAIRWEKGFGELAEYALLTRDQLHDMHESGQRAWGKHGVAINRMRELNSAISLGHKFDNNVAVLIPKAPELLLPILTFCESNEFAIAVRALDQTIKVTNQTLRKVPFDLVHWQKVAAQKYPQGLPKPFSKDPTQWLFNGYPRDSDQPLQVAVARLLGYRWPRQTGYSFPDCPAMGLDGLEDLADSDGIVCLSSAKGEPPGAERLREVLVLAYGEDWSASVLEDLLSKNGYSGKTLDDWLRNGFFEQHCVLFHHRPFIWHIWDGNKSGFSALVNYHHLTHANLEKLTYAYLGDWIRRQQAAVEAGDAGSDARLQDAKQLQSRLKLILEGEQPHDIFVRWKPLAKQAVGWNPDLNDGVRMNIRPFATADVFRKKVKIKWEKDRGKEPVRDKKDFPWFWKGSEFTGDRVNDVHLSLDRKSKA